MRARVRNTEEKRARGTEREREKLGGAKQRQNTHIHLRTHIHTHTHTLTHTYTHIHTHIHTHANTHSHTHTHTQNRQEKTGDKVIIALHDICPWQNVESRTISGKVASHRAALH